MKKERILILNTQPFGTLTDCYKWCQYLRDKYEITLICLDDIDRLEMESIRIIRVSNRYSKFIRGIRYILCSLWHILFFKGIVFVVYFEHCDLLKKLLPWKRMHLDVRTIAVWGNQSIRDRYDAQIRKTCLYYDSVSVISEGVKKRLDLENAWILPLGADVISIEPKNYFPLRLLYVGAFSYRHIEHTINGVRLFVDAHPQADIHYDLIGDGLHGELEYCKQLAKQLDLTDYITFHGRIDNRLLQPYFDKSNVGVSYVPITSYFNLQPPTKTFEYILSGLFCIATATEENKKVITNDNGIVIQDNADAFFKGLELVCEQVDQINENNIRQSLKEFTWDIIIDEVLIPNLFQKK